MRFQSKNPKYKVWLKPSRYKFDNFGNRVFEQGIFAEFQDGWFETDDPAIIKALKSNPMYGIDFWSIDEKKVEMNPEGKRIKETLEKKREELVTDCPICGKTFKNRAGLLGHMRFAHKNEK